MTYIDRAKIVYDYLREKVEALNALPQHKAHERYRHMGMFRRYIYFRHKRWHYRDDISSHNINALYALIQLHRRQYHRRH